MPMASTRPGGTPAGVATVHADQGPAGARVRGPDPAAAGFAAVGREQREGSRRSAPNRARGRGHPASGSFLAGWGSWGGGAGGAATRATPTAVRAMPAIVSGVRVSPNTVQAMRGVTGGTR